MAKRASGRDAPKVHAKPKRVFASAFTHRQALWRPWRRRVVNGVDLWTVSSRRISQLQQASATPPVPAWVPAACASFPAIRGLAAPQQGAFRDTRGGARTFPRRCIPQPGDQLVTHPKLSRPGAKSDNTQDVPAHLASAEMLVIHCRRPELPPVPRRDASVVSRHAPLWFRWPLTRRQRGACAPVRQALTASLVRDLGQTWSTCHPRSTLSSVDISWPEASCLRC
ncbi:hypothetical protein PSPO01_10750 [Paraphaeosphaeria sporulosa]